MRRIPGLSKAKAKQKLAKSPAANANRAPARKKARPFKPAPVAAVSQQPAAPKPTAAPPPSTTQAPEQRFAYLAIGAHFPGVPREHIVASHRIFPGHMRADIQPVVEQLFSARAARFVGILEHHRYETLTFSALLMDGQHAYMIAPLQYEDVDIGEAEPVRCLENGLWLCRAADDTPYAVLLSRHREPVPCGGRYALCRAAVAPP